MENLCLWIYKFYHLHANDYEYLKKISWWYVVLVAMYYILDSGIGELNFQVLITDYNGLFDRLSLRVQLLSMLLKESWPIFPSQVAASSENSTASLL